MMRTAILLTVGLAMALTLAAGFRARATASDARVQEPEPPATTLRVGTFRRTDLRVAYYRSTMFDEKLEEMREEVKRARAAGDEEKAAALESRGEAMQELAHQQLAGTAALGNVLEPLRASLPEIAAAAGVHIIVEAPLYAHESVETVDVTEGFVARFTPARKE